MTLLNHSSAFLVFLYLALYFFTFSSSFIFSLLYLLRPLSNQSCAFLVFLCLVFTSLLSPPHLPSTSLIFTSCVPCQNNPSLLLFLHSSFTLFFFHLFLLYPQLTLFLRSLSNQSSAFHVFTFFLLSCGLIVCLPYSLLLYSSLFTFNFYLLRPLSNQSSASLVFTFLRPVTLLPLFL